MKKQWIVVATAAILIVLSAIPAIGAQGPGPQGAGSEKVVKSSEPGRSYNPINWIKKDSSTKTPKAKKVKNVKSVKKVNNKKPSEKSAVPGTPVKPQQV